MNIGEAANRSGLSAKTIRYYEDIGLVVPRRQAANQYRDYSTEDIEQLVFLQHARTVGFGLDECRHLLDLYRNPARQSAHVKHLVLEKIAHLDGQMKALTAMREALSQMAEVCAGDESPQCAIIEELAHPRPIMPFTLVENSHE